MEEHEIYEGLEEVFADIFEEDDLKISADTTADTIEGWDSLSNVHMILAVEKAFKIRFKSFEVNNSRNVGEFVSLIKSKLK